MKNQEVKFKGINSQHGDVQLFEIENLPDNCKKINNKFIAASERSGHCHIMCGEYDMFEKEGVDGFFIKVGQNGSTLNHGKISELTPEVMSKNDVMKIADHKPNFYKPNTILFIGIQKRKKHFSKVWTKVQD